MRATEVVLTKLIRSSNNLLALTLSNSIRHKIFSKAAQLLAATALLLKDNT